MGSSSETPSALSLQSIPGLLLSVVLSTVAWAVSHVLSIPLIICALVLGLTCSAFVRPFSIYQPGIHFAASPLMKIAVACLGASVNFGVIVSLGWGVLSALLSIMSLTLIMSLWLGRKFGLTARFSVLSAGAAAICGSSAAIALCCVLPAVKTRERDLSAVIIGVSLLSAVGVLIYPLLVQMIGLNDIEAGFIMGGSLHNVAQAIAAGFIVSETAGETATIVKMLRVSLLVPCVLLAAYAFGHAERSTEMRGAAFFPPLFLIAFLFLMVAGSANWLSGPIKAGLDMLANIGLIIAMTAIGLSTSLSGLFQMDARVGLLMIIQTLLMLAGACAGLLFLSL